MNLPYHLARIAPKVRAMLGDRCVPITQAVRTPLLGSSAKFAKVQSLGMYLPAHLIAAATCPGAGECARTCISTTGRLGMNDQGMVNRASLLAQDPAMFLDCLENEVSLAVARGVTLFRLNGSSDLPFEEHFAPRHPGVAFIGYTKVLGRARARDGIFLAYSWSEKSTRLPATGGVAVVFPKEIKARLLEDTGIAGWTVVDGDAADTAWIEPALRGERVVQALAQKGKLKAGAFAESYKTFLALCGAEQGGMP